MDGISLNRNMSHIFVTLRTYKNKKKTKEITKSNAKNNNNKNCGNLTIDLVWHSIKMIFMSCSISIYIFFRPISLFMSKLKVHRNGNVQIAIEWTSEIHSIKMVGMPFGCIYIKRKKKNRRNRTKTFFVFGIQFFALF